MLTRIYYHSLEIVNMSGQGEHWRKNSLICNSLLVHTNFIFFFSLSTERFRSGNIVHGKQLVHLQILLGMQMLLAG